jgi:hypothetical protein
MLSAKLSPPPAAFTALLQHHLSPSSLVANARKAVPVVAGDQLRQALTLATAAEPDQALAAAMIQAAVALQVNARPQFVSFRPFVQLLLSAYRTAVAFFFLLLRRDASAY